MKTKRRLQCDGETVGQLHHGGWRDGDMETETKTGTVRRSENFNADYHFLREVL